MGNNVLGNYLFFIFTVSGQIVGYYNRAKEDVQTKVVISDNYYKND